MTELPDRKTIVDNESFTLSCTPPIFYDHGKQIDGPIATGTFFKIAERHFLITAWHTFEDFKAERILIPRKPTSDDFMDMGKYEVIYPTEIEYDVCALEIVDPSALRDLKRNWHFLSLSNIGLPSKNGRFLLFGFPTSIRDENPRIKPYQPLSAYASRLAVAPEGAPDRLPGDLDLFFEYGGIVDELDGGEREAPNLKAVSGASVWELQTPSPSLWVPPRVIGVEVSFRPTRYFRAVDWRVVAELLGLAYPHLRDQLRQHLGR
jgi:hypothetical protein